VDRAEDRAFIVRTTLNVVLIFVRHDGRVMSYRPSRGRLNFRPIRCPLFRCGRVRTTDGILIGFWCVFMYISFLGGVQPKSIEALNGKMAVRSAFWHVSIVYWVCITRWRFVSTARGFSA
jgi:hypothetical protein